MLQEPEQLTMIIGKTKCAICGKENSLTKEELVFLIEDCDTKDRIISLLYDMRPEDDMNVSVCCPKCHKENDLRRQDGYNS